MFPAEVGLLSSMRKYPGIQNMEFNATVPFNTGSFRINSLILHVPAIIHISSSPQSPDAIPQAFTSNIPAATGVPSGSRVFSLASFVTYPHMSAEYFSGGSLS